MTINIHFKECTKPTVIHYKLLYTSANPPTININYWTYTQFHWQSLSTTEHAQIFTDNLWLLNTHTVPLTSTINYCTLPQFHRQ